MSTPSPALLLAVLLLAGCAAAATRLWRELDFSDAGRADGTQSWPSPAPSPAASPSRPSTR